MSKSKSKTKRPASAATKRRLKAMRKKYGLGEFKKARLKATRRTAGPYYKSTRRKKTVQSIGFPHFP